MSSNDFVAGGSALACAPDWPARTLGQTLDWSIDTYGAEHEAFRFIAESSTWSLARLRRESHLLARALMAAGIEPGDAVAVWAPGRIMWPLVEFGAPIAGAVVCGLNTRYRSDELRYVLSTLKPRLVFVATGFLEIDSVELIRDAIHGLAAEIVICPPGGPHAGASGAGGRRGSVAGTDHVEGLDTFLARADRVSVSALARRRAQLDPLDPAIIQFTSGSTSRPKGVVLSHDAALRTAVNLTRTLGLGAEDLMYSPMPFYHIGGTLCTGLAAVVCGTPMIVPERFDPAAALEVIEASRCTAYQGHAAMFSMLLAEQEARPRDLSALRKGWAVAPPTLMARIHAELGMTDLVQTYGLSESGLVTGGKPDDPLSKRLTSIGRPVPETQVSLRDLETGTEVSTGEVGQIWVAGTSLMSSYLHDPQATAAALQNGWLATGDLGRFDEDGYLYFAGRCKDMIKPGGENVSILEVERFLLEQDGVRAVAVVGIPDDRLGEVPAAVIEVSRDDIRAEAIIAQCRLGLAAFKVPRRIWLIDELPQLEVGKADRITIHRWALEQLESEDPPT